MTQTAEEDARQKERDRYAKAIRGWYAAFKSVRLYSPEHPTTKETSQKFAALLETVFQNRFDFPLKQVDGLLIVDDFFFIEESLMLYDLLRSLENRNITQVVFLPGIQAREITDCIVYLQKNTPDTPSNDVQPSFSSDHIKTTSARDKDKSKNSTQDSFQASYALYQEWLELGEKTIARILEEQQVSLADLSISLDRMIDGITQRPTDFSMLICNRPLTNLHLQHSLHTMIQSIFLGQQMGFDPTSIKVLSLGALFHDIGRWLLPSDFVTGYKLGPTDAEMIQLHARDGTSFLAGVPGLPMSVVRATLEHHIGHDGLGYPTLPEAQKPHIFSQIIGLVDFVSWATVSERTYHKPVLIHRILRSMARRSGTQFSPLLVKLLLPFFGLFPPGTVVQLVSGERAVAMVPNLSHMARPTVLVEKPNKQWVPQLLSAVGDQPSAPFQSSVKRVLGRYENAESLISFLPNPSQPAA